MISGNKEIVVPASDSNEHQFEFKNPGRVTKIWFKATSTSCLLEIEDGEGIVHFASKGFDLSMPATTFGYQIPLEDGIAVGPGSPLTVRLTDYSTAENTVNIVLVGISARKVA